MKYGIEVYTRNPNARGIEPVWSWKRLHPSGGEPYVFDTKEEAERACDMCYPVEHREFAKVVLLP